MSLTAIELTKTEVRMTLIQAIESLISKLKDGTIHYYWNNFTSCNCGLLAQELIGCNESHLDKIMCEIPFGARLWTITSKYCKSTGICYDTIFKYLFETGLTIEDIEDLEYLSNEEILKETDIDTDSAQIVEYYKVKSNLVKYLKGWLVILERQQKKEFGQDIKLNQITDIPVLAS